jgi:tRNA G18 (ribose-2'-O)-methylase SpoU
VERLLDRSAKDSDFIIDQKDHSNPLLLERIPLVGVLDHLRSAFNVGSIFRVADGMGVLGLHLIGYTALPDSPAVSKTSLGAGKVVPWAHFNHLSESIAKLKADNFEVVALETAQGSESLFDFRFSERTALVVGNERFGLNSSDVSRCDRVLRIPLRGTKNSLNVVSAFAIASFEYSRQMEPGPVPVNTAQISSKG